MEPTVGGNDYVAVATKAVPSLSVTGLSAAGVSLQDWVYIVTIIYTVLMTLQMVYKFFKDKRNGG